MSSRSTIKIDTNLGAMWGTQRETTQRFGGIRQAGGRDSKRDSTLMQRFGERGLTGAHVAVCGPAGLVAAAERAARAVGATTIEREDFDIRQGFGPDLSATSNG